MKKTVDLPPKVARSSFDAKGRPTYTQMYPKAASTLLRTFISKAALF
jgi:hypothetical protein